MVNRNYKKKKQKNAILTILQNRSEPRNNEKEKNKIIHSTI